MPEPSEERPFSSLVVVGSWAYGIEALSELLSNLPQDFSAPFVLAQYLDPERESNLKEILGNEEWLALAQRAALLDGSLAMTCYPRGGTRVEVALPLKGGG